MKNNRSFAKPVWLGVYAAILLAAGCTSNSPAPVVTGRGQATPPTVTAAVATTYTVKKGDTLYSIAREQGIDFRDLIALNNIESPARISQGMVLKIRPVEAPSPSTVATTAPVTSDVVVSRPIGPDQAIEKRPSGGNSDLVKREPKGGKEPYSDQALALAQGLPKPPEAAAATVEAKPEIKPEAKAADAASGAEDTGWVWPANGKIIGTFTEGGSKGIDIAGRTGDPVIATSSGKVILANNTLRGYGNMVVIKHSNAWLTVYAHNSKLLVKEGQTVSKGQKIAEMGNTDADQVKLHFEVRRQGTPIDPLKYLPLR